MDLTSPAWMQSPLRARPAQLPGAARLVGPHAVDAVEDVADRGRQAILGMDASPVPPEYRGDADGADIIIDGGIVLRRRRVGQARVSDRELNDAIRGVLLLPAADRQRIAASRVPIELLPVASLGVGELGGPILGATTIDGVAGMWSPTLVRVAVRSPLSANAGAREAVGEIVQHELGHVSAVLTGQDRSEAAAERYALMN